MLKRALFFALAAALLMGAALAEGPLCVVSPQVTALVDGEGRELLSGEGIDALFAVREGTLYAAGTRGAYRLYDAGGSPVGGAVFSMIDDAGDALVFRAGGLYGAMDGAGNVLVDPVWTQLTPGEDGGWLALDGDPLDERADEIIRLPARGEPVRTGAYTLSGLAPVAEERMPFLSAEGRWGATDAFGAVAVAPEWLGMGAFKDGLAKVWGADGAGLVNAAGTVVLPAVYDWLERSEGFVACLDVDGLSVLDGGDLSLRFRVPGEDLDVAVVGACLSVRDGGACCLYGADGALLLEADRDTAFAPGTNGQVIAMGGAWGEANQRLVNPDGSAASEGFQRLLPLCPGRYAFLTMAGTEYYSDELGGIQTSWNYDSVRWGLLDNAGQVLLPAEYTEIRTLSDDRLLLLAEGVTILADADGLELRRWEDETQE